MSDEQEINVAGVKVKAGGNIGKMFMYGTAIVTVIGGLYGGFEVYKDYMDMKKKILTYTAPDLSGFDKRLSILDKKMDGVVDSVTQARDYTRDIKNDLKKDINTIEKTVDDVERRGKEAFRLQRESIETNDSKVRQMITTNSDRFDSRREQLRRDMDALETRIKSEMKDLDKKVDDKIKKALNNPLSKM